MVTGQIDGIRILHSETIAGRGRKSAAIWTTGSFLVLLMTALPVISAADTHAAASCSFLDVLSAYNAATAGDSVEVPAGSCIWSSELSITKPVILRGAGPDLTLVTNSMPSGSSLINIAPSSNAFLIRITAFGFQLGPLKSGRRAITIKGKPSTSFIPTNLRIDHNAITGGGGDPGAITTIGRVFGLIDHNTFTNCYSAVFGWGIGYDNQAWIDAYNAGGIFAGTANAMFVEDNSFILNNDAGSHITTDAQVYLQEGGSSYVVRYNTFDASAVTNPNIIELMYNHHGNQDYCLNYPGTCFRGMPIFESYNNTGICSSSSCEFMSIRGGAVLIHDETFSSSGNALAILKVSEEECWQSAFFSPLRTAWPAQDQVTNSFFWNVTFNGKSVVDLDFGSENNRCSASFIRKDRDYFMHAPCGASDSKDAYGNACTYGRTSFVGSRFGASSTMPTAGDTSTMVFTPNGANAFYPYTSYPYPHPFQASNFLDAPAQLRVVQEP